MIVCHTPCKLIRTVHCILQPAGAVLFPFVLRSGLSVLLIHDVDLRYGNVSDAWKGRCEGRCFGASIHKSIATTILWIQYNCTS